MSAAGGRLPVRGPVRRRRRGQRRASRRLDGATIIGVLAMLAAAGGIYAAASSPVFAVAVTEVTGSVLTGSSSLAAALDLGAEAPNAFSLRTDILRDRLAALPGVERAEVSVSLPGTVRVRLVERTPVLAWHVGSAVLLVDRDGDVIADAGSPDTDDAGRALAASLPAVIDRRFDAVLGALQASAASPRPQASGPQLGPAAGPIPAAPGASAGAPAASAKPGAKVAASAKPGTRQAGAGAVGARSSPDPGSAGANASAVDGAIVDPAANSALGATAVPRLGEALDALDLDIATRLLSLSPADIGSRAAGFRVVVDSADGWTLRPTKGDAWVAVFGHYTSEMRKPELIPAQVRLLRSMLVEVGEAHVQRVMLADANGGTYIAR